MDSMEYRPLRADEINRALFRDFERRQEVVQCWRREGDRWVIREDPFIDQWDEKDYAFLVQCLQNTIRTGGLVLGAFAGGRLKGFASVEAAPLGSRGQYLDLTSLHVSADMRRMGMGKVLFRQAAKWAADQGAEKLYISSHSAAETQAFYRALGCVDALEPDPVHVSREPFDCQLEYELSNL